MKKLLVFLLILLGFSTTDSLATLKLTCPKGGEKFVVGCDTLITWEGILATDTVKLEYSIDGGINWQLITDTATGLQYVWKNVPKPTSEECLVRIKPYSKTDSSNFEPAIEWQKTYGGSKDEYAYDIKQTSDGGYITAGWTLSDDGDITKKNGSEDAWLLKLNNLGSIEWEKTYGSSLEERFSSIQQTLEGGYIASGWSAFYGGMELWIVKLDIKGNLEWELRYIHNNYWRTYASIVQQTIDGGYIVAGSTEKNDKSSEGLILKLDKYGKIEWENNYNFNNEFNTTIHYISQIKDSGYIMLGWNSKGTFLIKLNELGNILWEKYYAVHIDGNGGWVVQQTKDEGFILSGHSDIVENLGKYTADAWVMKLDRFGDIEWDKTYGGSNYDFAYTASETKDSGFIVIGNSWSNDGDLTGNNGKSDDWIFKLNKIGDIKWQKNIGGSGSDFAGLGQRTSDGGYIISGYTESTDIPGCTNKGAFDFYIVKLGPSLQSTQSDSTFSIVAPLAAATDIDMGKCVINTQKDSTVAGFVNNAGTYKLQVDSIYFRGADANDFSLVWGSPKFTLNPSVGLDVRFRFVPSRLGIHNADIVIITNSDTLIRRIQGEGVPPRIQVLHDVIDFGKVVVGTHKDTLQAVTIKNINSGPITIIKTKHNKPNDYDFSTLAGGGNFTLQPGDTAKLDLRFAPSAIGYTYGTLEFYTEGLSIPSFVVLQGEGINKNPVIQASAEIDYNLICSNTVTNYVPIFNNGGDTLRITEINITGTNYTEFSVNQTMPVLIPPISPKNIEVEFKPKSYGTKTANLEIKSNSDPNTNITIPITAKRDSMNLSFVENTIDLGYLCPNQTKDTLIHVTNYGFITTGAYLTNSQNLSFGKSEITVLPSNTENITIRFNGLNTEGIINETITLTDSICGFSKTITITGKIQAPKLESIGLVITCVQLTSNDGILTLENKSDRSILIQSAPVISAPFSFVGNPFPLSIPANSSEEITLRYTATDYISHSIPLRFFVEPCGLTFETTVIGVVSVPTAVIKIDSLSAYAGEIINIPIILIDGNYLDISGVTTIQTDLIFNPTLLTPLNRSLYPVQKIDGNHAKIGIANIPFSIEIGKELINIPFVAGLGNAESCDLVLENSTANGGVTDIETQPGTFKLLGICREGGTRLIAPTGKVEILSIIPNPASDEVEISVNLIEEGTTILSVFNSNGVKIKELIIKGETGSQTISLDGRAFANGLYFIQLQTPTVVENKKLMIVK